VGLAIAQWSGEFRSYLGINGILCLKNISYFVHRILLLLLFTMPIDLHCLLLLLVVLEERPVALEAPPTEILVLLDEET